MNEKTLLLRQIHPSWVQDGRVTSQAFCPTEAHQGLLSTYDQELIDCQTAFAHFTKELQKKSTGIRAIAVADCAVLNLPVRSDPDTHPSHAVVDFTEYDRKPRERKAKELRNRSEVHGWLFGPVTTS